MTAPLDMEAPAVRRRQSMGPKRSMTLESKSSPKISPTNSSKGTASPVTISITGTGGRKSVFVEDFREQKVASAWKTG